MHRFIEIGARMRGSREYASALVVVGSVSHGAVNRVVTATRYRTTSDRIPRSRKLVA
jgi:hypothetical protein